MNTYWFRGTVTRDGVDFYIEANSLEEAKGRARKGQYDHRDDAGAETIDWEIDPESGTAEE